MTHLDELQVNAIAARDELDRLRAALDPDAMVPVGLVLAIVASARGAIDLALELAVAARRSDEVAGKALEAIRSTRPN